MRKKFKLPWSDYELKLQHRDQNPLGQELADDTPMAPPIGYKKQPSMIEHVRNMIRSENLRIAAEAAGQESFDEADDFDVDDDVDPHSVYEWEPSFDPAPPYSVTPTPQQSPEGVGAAEGGLAPNDPPDAAEPTSGPPVPNAAAAAVRSKAAPSKP